MKKIFCPNCKRELPNKSYRTKNGCYWCDVERARKGNK